MGAYCATELVKTNRTAVDNASYNAGYNANYDAGYNANYDASYNSTKRRMKNGKQ